MKQAKRKTKEDILKEVSQDSNLGFIGDLGLSRAAATHAQVHANATPKQKAIMAEASKAMAEVEHIFDGPILDENIAFVQKFLSESGVILGDFDDAKARKISEKIKALKLNQYLIIEGKAFFMTGDKKIQEAASYVNRLEKTTIRFMNDRAAALEQELKAKADLKSARFLLSDYENVLSLGFFGKLKFVFWGK